MPKNKQHTPASPASPQPKYGADTRTHTESMSPEDIYREYIERGDITKNQKQYTIIKHITLFIAQIAQKNNTAWWQSVIRKRNNRNQYPRAGIYIWGQPGNGKTMIMDIAAKSAEQNGIKTKRVHFHHFMQTIHNQIHEKKQERDKQKPIPAIVRTISQNTQLICLDEFEVIDITDAMILKRLLEAMISHDIALIITSNTAPKNLYRHGLNRQLFVPFIELVEKSMHILDTNGIKDYRKQFLIDNRRYFHPLNKKTESKINHIWEHITKGKDECRKHINVKGRTLIFERCSGTHIRTTFDTLCDQPLGAVDYIEIAKHFDTILIENIPILNKQKRNQARRFIVLIDTLYDTRKCLIISAQAAPEKLWAETANGMTEINGMTHERTVSRLIEMNTPKWVEQPNQS